MTANYNEHVTFEMVAEIRRHPRAERCEIVRGLHIHPELLENALMTEVNCSDERWRQVVLEHDQIELMEKARRELGHDIEPPADCNGEWDKAFTRIRIDGKTYLALWVNVPSGTTRIVKKEIGA